MGQQAKVSSLEAIEAFRARLVVYVGQARAALDEVTSDVTRTRTWLETEARTNWEKELRRRGRALEEAQAALFSARLSKLRQETSYEQLLVHKAKRSFDESEQKLRVVKQWTREFENRAQPLLKQMEKLHTVLTHDMTLALAGLAQTISTLSAYAEIPLPGAVEGSAPVPKTVTESGTGSEKGEP